MRIKTEEQLETLKEAGKRLNTVLSSCLKQCAVGVSTKHLDDVAREIIKSFGDRPSFLGYKPHGADRPYPAALCVSINDQIVHGIPNESEREIKDGDIISLDCGLVHRGFFVDAARTIIVGKQDATARKLVEATKKAIDYALCAVQEGNTVGDIGNVIEQVADKYKFTIPPELGGHGVGAAVHEEPFIANIGNPGEGEVLVSGDVLAIEPIFFEGSVPSIELDSDGHTYKTADGSRAAHFEETVVVQPKGAPIIVTAL